MAKHGKNQQVQPWYSSRERAKDNQSEGYGTQKRRAGTDAVQQFDCCHLSSQPATNPVVTPDGYLYDKECILENLLQQKMDNKRKQKEYLKQKARLEAEAAKDAAAAETKAANDFVAKERSVSSSLGQHFVTKAGEKSQAGKMLEMRKERIYTEGGKVVPKLPSFWIPTLTPGSKETELKPPSSKTKCPMSGKTLRIKDLIPVNFTPADKLSSEKMVARKERFICALTQKVLRNAIPCVLLKPTGTVITKEAYERLVKPDMIDPLSGSKLTDADIIPLKSAGTGFAGGGAEIKKRKTAAQMVS